MTTKKISIYDYIDYTQYLNDWFAFKKEHSSHYSHKLFADKIGVKSSSYITMIVNGTRKIPRKLIFTFAQALNLSSKETKYFEAIVMYNESKGFDEKNYYWDIANNLRPYTKPTTIEKKQFDYFSHWYIPVLRELVTYVAFDNDYEKLGRMITPPITAKQAEQGVQLLIDLNLIQPAPSKESSTNSHIISKKKRSLYIQTDTLLITPNTLKLQAVHTFQKQTMELAQLALFNTPVTERNIQTTTIGTTEQGAFELNKLIEEFQAKVLHVVEKNSTLLPTKVYQLNIQLFPVTKENYL